MKKLCLLYFSVLINLIGVGQTPAHFFLGEDELFGVHIYDLHQDKALNYWIASNKGLYKYDGYNFELTECRDILSPSVFNVTSDSKGNIYCHNLSGQIFKINKEGCEVYYQIPDSLMNPLINIQIDYKDNLIVLAKSLIKISPEKTPLILPNFKMLQIESIILPDRELFVVKKFRDTFQTIYMSRSDTVYNEIPLVRLIEKKSCLLPVFNGTEIILFDRATNLFFKMVKDSLIPISHLSSDPAHLGIYAHLGVHVNRDLYWVPKASGGVLVFPDINDPVRNQKSIFNDFKISSFFEDQEGNILMGTFNHGIIVIPKSVVTDIDLDGVEGSLSSICKAPENGIAFGTSAGNMGIVNSNGTMDYFNQVSSSSIEFLEFMPNEKSYLVGSYDNYVITPQREKKEPLKLGAIKDLKPLNNGDYLIALNTGVTLYRTFGNPTDLFSNDNEPILNSLDHKKYYLGRTYAVDYDSINKTIYICTSNGLKQINKEGTKTVKINGKNILCRDLLYLNDKMYVITHNNGILIFQNNELNGHWTSENELVSNTTELILSDGEFIFITTSKGIQILTQQGETYLFLNKSNGLYADHIIDVELNNGYLWVLHQKGLQKVDLSKIEKDHFTPEIVLESIHINNLPVPILEKSRTFRYDENKFAFSFSSKSLKYRNEINYLYRLMGVDEEWQKKNYADNYVEYKTLPPGTYEFQVKATYRSTESDVVSYTFSISAPFWSKWWFHVSIILTLVLAMYLYLLYQMRKKMRTAKIQEELYESKLTAIQAQMNPHFIFNSLNSIQDLVLKNDAENAYTYISKFALLVRNTLNHSDKDFIDFNQELASIELYLILEKLRFKDAFNYKIIAPEDVDIQIPPMLIQPFIENSLVHGLLHKQGAKVLSVEFELEEDVLVCTITDNGIGRKEAKLIQKRQYTDHESFALKAIKKRLEILEFRYGGEFDLQYVDLMEQGNSAGTQVILKIPYLKNY